METTVVEFGWGDYIPMVAAIVGAVALAALAWGVRQLPASVQDFFRVLQVEQLVKRSVDYGINAVVGATKDRKLSVDLGNEVIAYAANYALNEGAARVIEYAGGAEGIKRKILARLDLEADASEAAMVVPAVPKRIAVR